jgi:hypothetical protein
MCPAVHRHVKAGGGAGFAERHLDVPADEDGLLADSPWCTQVGLLLDNLATLCQALTELAEGQDGMDTTRVEMGGAGRGARQPLMGGDSRRNSPSGKMASLLKNQAGEGGRGLACLPGRNGLCTICGTAECPATGGDE